MGAASDGIKADVGETSGIGSADRPGRVFDATHSAFFTGGSCDC